MQLKNIAMNDFELLNNSLNEWIRFLASNQTDYAIKRMVSLIIKIIENKKDSNEKKVYFKVLEQLTALMIVKNFSEINFHREKEKFFNVDQDFMLQQAANFNQNDLETNILRFLFAKFYEGNNSDYFKILLDNTPKVTVLKYLGSILDDLKYIPVSEISKDLACILAIEINNQQNDFFFTENLDTRVLSLYFENISFFILMEPIEESNDLEVSYVEVLKIEDQYFQNRKQNIIINNFNQDLITKGSTEEVLSEIMKTDEMFIRIVRSIAKAEEMAIK